MSENESETFKPAKPSVVVTDRQSTGRKPHTGKELHVISMVTGADRLLWRTEADQVVGLLWDTWNRSVIIDLAEHDATARSYRFRARLISVSITTGQVTTLIDGYANQAEHDPILSPDGRRAVFSATDPRFSAYYPTSHRLEIVDFTRRTIIQVEGGETFTPRAIKWNHSSSQFEFVRPINGDPVVENVDANTGHAVRGRQEIFPKNAVGWPSKSRDGQITAWAVVEEPSERRILLVARRSAAGAARRYVLDDPTA